MDLLAMGTPLLKCLLKSVQVLFEKDSLSNLKALAAGACWDTP